VELIGVEIAQLLAVLVGASLMLLAGAVLVRGSGGAAQAVVPDLAAGPAVEAGNLVRPSVGSVSVAPSRGPPGTGAWRLNDVANRLRLTV
jgi:hypothetical protein